LKIKYNVIRIYASLSPLYQCNKEPQIGNCLVINTKIYEH